MSRVKELHIRNFSMLYGNSNCIDALGGDLVCYAETCDFSRRSVCSRGRYGNRAVYSRATTSYRAPALRRVVESAGMLSKRERFQPPARRERPHVFARGKFLFPAPAKFPRESRFMPATFGTGLLIFGKIDVVTRAESSAARCRLAFETHRLSLHSR